MQKILWPEPRKARLRALWDSGMPAAKIAIELDCTTNAVLGQARRSNLPMRQPHRPAKNTKTRNPGAARCITSPWNAENEKRLIAMWNNGIPVAQIVASLGVTDQAVQKKVRRMKLTPRSTRFAAPATPKPKPILPAVEPRPMVVFKPRALTQCNYPFGDLRRGTFRFCEAMAEGGKPYCAEHMAVCYHGYAPHASSELPAI